MNPARLRDNEPLREQLAAEYVLGTLRGGARRRFERWLQDDPVLGRAVAEWQDRLQPMAELVPAAHPSPQVWQSIEQRLDLGAAGPHAGARSWRDSLRFWRAFGLASGGLAAALLTALIAVLLFRPLQPAAPTYVATLTNAEAHPALLVAGDANRHRLTVKFIERTPLAADKSLQLWAVPAQGAPRSLGLLTANGSISLPLPAHASPAEIPLLAVSLEPKGGSPNPHAPSGPILFKGAWVQL